MATDSRVICMAQIRVYEPGQADPYLIDQGWGWYDLLRESWPYGESSLSLAGERNLEYVEGVGVCCRPSLVLQDTRLAHYSTSGGTWEERRPATGSPRKYRLVQRNTTAGVVYSATSSFSLPQNPHVAFSLQFLDAPADWDATTYPQLVRIEFGQGRWALEFSKAQGSRLLRWNAATLAWEVWGEISEPEGSGLVEVDERIILLRCLRGRICVSLDRGRSYQLFGEADGSDVTVLAGPYTVRGQGGQFAFGLHQLAYSAGTYLSPVRQTFTARLGAATISGRGNTPAGTLLTFTDVSTPAAGLARYRANLTPTTLLGVPFTFHTTPELWAVSFRYPVSRSLFIPFWSLPFDGAVFEIDISKPLALDGATCTLRIRKDAGGLFTGNWRWRAVQVVLGELYEDGTEAWTTAFSGYVRRVSLEQGEFNRQSLVLELENATIRAKRMVATPFETPLGGLTVNAALDEVLIHRMGLTASYRVWHPAGDVLTLPAGLAEDPFLWPRAGQTWWEVMQQIAELAGLEIGVDDAGVWYTVPLEYVQPFVSGVFQADPPGDTKWGIGALRVRYDAGESATRVLVEGQDATSGAAIFAWGADSQAESFPIHPRFCPWPELHHETVPGTTTPGILAGLVQARMVDLVPPKVEAELSLPNAANVALSRRQRVQVWGTSLGISDFDQFAILGLNHHWERTPTECRTHVLLRRLG